MDYRGPGRPPDLTWEVLESICQRRAEGSSIVEACRSHYINPDTYHEWRNRGLADREAGVRSIYAEFSDRIPNEEARGRVALRGAIHEAVRLGLPVRGKNGTLKAPDPKVAFAAIQAGKLALATLMAQDAGRRGAAKRWGKGDLPPPGAASEATSPGAKRIDFSRLGEGEYKRYQELAARARGAFEEMGPAEVLELQALMRKARTEQAVEERDDAKTR